VALAAPAGERHALPVAMAADQLRWAGFEVLELGADTPAESLVALVVATPAPAAVVLSVASRDALRSASASIAAMRAASSVPVVLGVAR